MDSTGMNLEEILFDAAVCLKALGHVQISEIHKTARGYIVVMKDGYDRPFKLLVERVESIISVGHRFKNKMNLN